MEHRGNKDPSQELCLRRLCFKMNSKILIIVTSEHCSKCATFKGNGEMRLSKDPNEFGYTTQKIEKWASQGNIVLAIHIVPPVREDYIKSVAEISVFKKEAKRLVQVIFRRTETGGSLKKYVIFKNGKLDSKNEIISDVPWDDVTRNHINPGIKPYISHVPGFFITTLKRWTSREPLLGVFHMYKTVKYKVEGITMYMTGKDWPELARKEDVDTFIDQVYSDKLPIDHEIDLSDPRLIPPITHLFPTLYRRRGGRVVS